jgi:hypothetical protein
MRRILTIALTFCVAIGFAQESKEQGIIVTQIFDDTRIVNGHSVETNEKGQMKFIIGHRFGQVDGGIDELYGLDQATMRLGFDYGINDWLTIGVGRSSFEKTLDGFVKARFLNQREGNGSPVTLTWLSTAAVRTNKNINPDQDDFPETRWDYVNQILIARKFSDKLSVQLMPTHLHKNLVATSEESNDIISIGGAAKYQLSKLISLKTEYYFTLPDQLPDNRENSLSFGLDFKTKHHVFQMHFSTSRGMTEKFFIGETFNNVSPGKFMFGFNITRNFQLTGKKYK